MAFRKEQLTKTRENAKCYVRYKEGAELYSIGLTKLMDIKYSDILQFYYYLLNERDIALGTLDSIHCLLHPTFQLAVRESFEMLAAKLDNVF